MAEGSKSNLFSIFGGKKRIPKDSYKAYLTWAIAVDALLFWLPGAGDFFILYCRGMWWLNGYNTDKMMAETLLNAAGELLPFVPCSTTFVFISYRINKANTDPLAGEESEGDSRREEAEGKAIRALEGRNRSAQSGGAEQPGGAQQGSGGSGKQAGGAGETRDAEHLVNKDGSRPQSQSLLKETPNKGAPTSNKSVDGIAPQGKNESAQMPRYQPTQPVFKQQPANDNAPETATSEKLPGESTKGDGAEIAKDAPSQETDDPLKENNNETAKTPAPQQNVPKAEYAYASQQPAFEARSAYNTGGGSNSAPEAVESDESPDDTEVPEQSETSNSDESANGAPTEEPESEEVSDEDTEEPEQPEIPNEEDGGEFFDNARRVA